MSGRNTSYGSRLPFKYFGHSLRFPRRVAQVVHLSYFQPPTKVFTWISYRKVHLLHAKPICGILLSYSHRNQSILRNGFDNVFWHSNQRPILDNLDETRDSPYAQSIRLDLLPQNHQQHRPNRSRCGNFGHCFSSRSRRFRSAQIWIYSPQEFYVVKMSSSEEESETDRATGEESAGASRPEPEGHQPEPTKRRPGQPRKETKDKVVSTGIQLHPSEFQRLKDGQKRHECKSIRAYIVYLMGLDAPLGTGGSTPRRDRSAVAAAPPTVSPIGRPTTASSRASRGSTRGGSTSRSSSLPTSTPGSASGTSSFATPVSSRRPSATGGKRKRLDTVYRGASQVVVTDDNLEDHDPFDFDPEQEGSEAPGAQYSFLETSVNVSDHFGRALDDPPSPSAHLIGYEEKLRLQKKKEPKQPFDFSESRRLLPERYYEKWSAGRNVRLHDPPEEQPDKYGQMSDTKKSKKARLKQPKKQRSALDIVSDGRWIVEFHELLKLISPKCYHADCDAHNLVDKPQLYREGAALRITIKCEKGHKKIWWTCRRLQHRTDNRVIYCSTNVLLAAAVAVSGNSFQKAGLLFKALNLRAISQRQYSRLQTFIIAPTVHQCWLSEQKMIVDSLNEAKCSVVLAGDGTFDSPGHTAMYCTYVQMITGVSAEEDVTKDGQKVYEKTGYVATINVTDKRHTDLVSPRMEAAGYLRSMIDLASLNVNVDEIVTDAHSEIKLIMSSARNSPELFKQKAVDTLKKFTKLPVDYLDLSLNLCKSALHQMDVWHRAKSIGKMLLKMKIGRGRENYEHWAMHVKNHFFFTAHACFGDIDAFKEIWFGVLHHVQGDHIWSTGECLHKEELEAERAKRIPQPPKRKPRKSKKAAETDTSAETEQPEDASCGHGSKEPMYITDPKSRAFKAIQSVATSKFFVKDFAYYTKA